MCVCVCVRVCVYDMKGVATGIWRFRVEKEDEIEANRSQLDRGSNLVHVSHYIPSFSSSSK